MPLKRAINVIDFIALGLLFASQPAMAPSGGKNTKSEQVAYRQTYNDMGTDVISNLLPAGKAKTVSQALYATVKKEVKEEIKEQAQKQIDKQLAKSNPFSNKSKDDLISDKKTFTEIIRDHKNKLEEFKKDPIGNSSEAWLKTATKDNPSREVLLERAKGRIPALEKQIKKQEGELNKINE